MHRCAHSVAVSLAFAAIMFAVSGCRPAASNPDRFALSDAGSHLLYVNGLCAEVLAAQTNASGVHIDSISDTVRAVTHLRYARYWSCGNDTNKAIHIKPDLQKWMRSLKQSELAGGLGKEVAAYYGAPLSDTNKLFYLGVTFGEDLIRMTRPPEWPSATFRLTNAP